MGSSNWVNSPAAGPYTPPQTTPAPGAVASVTLSRDDGTVTATWPAADHAATYHITYTTDGAQSWQLAALNHPATQGQNTITIDNADNDATYIVGVRARNQTGASNWVNSPAAGPYTPPPPTEPPDRPTGLSATAGDSSVTLAWDDPSDPDITGYEYLIRVAPPAPGWGPWTAVAGSDATTTSVTIDSLTNGTEYRFKIRAVNAAGGSPAAPFGAPWYIAATPNLAPVLNAESTTATTGTLTMGNYSGEWHYQTTGGSGTGGGSGASAQSQQSGCIGPIGGSQTTVDGLDPNSQYAYTAYSNPQCSEQVGAASAMVTPAQNAGATLTANSITRASATLTRWGFTQPWHYKANRGPHSSSCSAAVTGANTALTGLSTATHYVYTAYSDAQCSTTPLATGEFTTLPTYDFSVSLTPNIGTLTHNGVTLTPRHWATNSWTGDWYYKSNKAPHNTGCLGPVPSGGPLHLTGLHASTSYTYTMYDYRNPVGGACEVDIAEVSFTAAALPSNLTIDISTLTGDRITLAPSGWDQAWYYQKHKDGSAEGSCTGPVGPGAATLSTALLADSSYTYKVYAYAGCASADEIASHTFSVPALASAPAKTSARLTLTNWPSSWWYRQLGVYGYTGNLVSYFGPCRGPFAPGASTVATGLDSGETYGIQAFSSGAACGEIPNDSSRLLAAGLLGSIAKVTTVSQASLSPSDVTASGATLTISGYSGEWFAKQTAPAAGPCSSAITGAAHQLTSLVEGRSHTYAAYNDPNCTTQLATATFTTLSLAASSVTNTAATLTLTGHSGNWWYKADTGPHNTCQGPVSGTTASLTGLTSGTPYTYTAYRNSGCAAADELASETVTPLSLAATGITSMGAVLTLAGSHTGNWYYEADTGPHSSTCQGPASATAITLNGLSPNTSYTYTAYRDSGCATSLTTAPAFTTIVSLTATDIAVTSATLAIDGHTGQWWYKANTGPDSSCKGPVSANTATKSVTGLTEQTDYTYAAYSQTGCPDANLLATASTFDTEGMSVGNLSETNTGGRPVGYVDTPTSKLFAFATKFTTDSAGGYTLDKVQARFGIKNHITTNLHAHIYTDNSGKPGTSRKDLGGAQPNNTVQTWECSGSSCGLNASTTYWLVMRINSNYSSSFTSAYYWRYTNSSNETNNPTSASWTLGNDMARGPRDLQSGSGDQWESTLQSGAGMFKLVVQVTPTLDASDIIANSATLTLSNYGGVWWYERTSPSGDSTCHRVDAGNAARLSGLTASTSYTYKAYDNPDCASANEIASETFSATTASTPTLAASGVTASAATLTIGNHTGAWYYQANTGPDSTCQGPVSSGTSTKALTGLTGGTAYTYGAYSDSGCSALLASESFTALSLAANSAANTTITLTLGGSHTGAWHYRHTSPSGGTCSSAVSGTSATVANLSPGTDYTFSAYRDSGCASLLAAAAAISTDGLTASSVTPTSATLTIAGHTANWYLKEAAPNTGTCSATAITGATKDLTSLSPRTTYTYTAYSDSGCTTAVTSGTFTTLARTLTASSVTASKATLTIDGHTTAWYYKADTGPDSGTNTCRGPVSSGTSTKALTGLTSDTAYTYTAYSNATCSGEIAAAPAFTTLALSARDIADSTATLKLANRTAHWYYKATTAPHTTCQGPVSGTDAALTGLTSGGTYTYSAYGDATCTSANLLATASAFTTHGATITVTSATTATLAVTGFSGKWWYGSSTKPYTSCYGPITGAGSTNLAGLTPGTSYTFTVHFRRGCPAAKIIATAPITTASLTASNVIGTTATLTIGNYTGNWHYMADTGPDTSCTGPVSTTTKDLSGLTAGATYTYTAYSDSGCNTDIAIAIFATLSPPGGVGAQERDVSNTTSAVNSLQVWWDRPSGATGAISYTVECSTDSGTSYASCATKSATTDSDLIVTITNTGVNKVRVRSTQNSLNSTWAESNVPSGAAPGAPANVTNTAMGVGNRVQWPKPSSPSGAVGYQTQCRASNTDWMNCGSNGNNGVIAPTSDSIVTTDVYYSHFRVRSVLNGLVSAWTASSRTSFASLTASSVTTSGATLTVAGFTGNWYYKANTGPDNTCKGPVSGTNAALTGLTPGTTYTYTAYADRNCPAATLLVTAPAFTTLDSLTASKITATGAELTLASATTTWYYKANTGPDSTCKGPFTTATKTLTGLTADTWYLYRAYSDSGCSTKLAAETFTAAVTVSSVDTSSSSVADVGLRNNAIWMVGQAFTTGSNSGGYTLSSVTAAFSANSDGDQGNIVVELHEASTSNSLDPGDLLATLSGTDHTPVSEGNYTFTCSTGCALEANTSYFITIEAPSASSGRYLLEITSQDSETKVPTSNGWAIANDARVGIKASNYWDINSGNTAQLILAASPNPSLAASSITYTTATLTLTGPTGNWWLKQTAPSSGTCTAGEADYSHALSSLTAGTSYTYAAYADASCTTETVTGTFTTSPVVAPGAPRNVEASVIQGSSRGYGDCEVEIKWDAPTNDGGATVSYTYQAQDTGSVGTPWHTAASGNSQMTSTHDFNYHFYYFGSLGVTSGVTYNVRIRANNSAGSSSWVQVSGISNGSWACA